MKYIILENAYTATAARKKCSEILNRYGIGDEVVGEDFRFLQEVFTKYHYDPMRKIPSPIVKIWVGPSNSGSNGQFYFEMENCAIDHIGFTTKCFVTEAKKLKLIREDNVIDAARRMIRYQQDQARAEFIQSGNLGCGICGSLVTKVDLVADHKPPHFFKDILDDWLKARGLKLEDIEYHDVNGTEEREFTDEELGRDWVSYHQSRFFPQPAHKSCNLRQGNRIKKLSI